MGISTLKKTLGLLAGVAQAGLVGCNTLPAPQACSPMPDGKARPLLIAPYRGGIGLDGDLSDWKGIPFTTVTPTNGLADNRSKPASSSADLSYRFAVCHDDQSLYVAVEVTDDRICADSCVSGSVSCPAWDDDSVEVFIDGNHNHARNSRMKDRSELAFGGEFALVANGAANSDYSGYPKSFGKLNTWQGATNWLAVQKGEKTARYEFRLTWNVMGGKVRQGETIGISIAVQDDDDGGKRDHLLYFCGNPPDLFTDERGFADLYLQPRFK